MNDRKTDWALEDINGGTLLTAAVLVGVGGVIGVAGLTVAGAAFASAAWRWYTRVDLTPQEIARLKWEQARGAVKASADAWQQVEADTYVPRRARA